MSKTGASQLVPNTNSYLFNSYPSQFVPKEIVRRSKPKNVTYRTDDIKYLARTIGLGSKSVVETVKKCDYDSNAWTPKSMYKAYVNTLEII